MPKRKKKPNRLRIQKISKAHHRKAYLERLKYFCDNICGEKIFGLIPEKEMALLYDMRFQSVRVEKGPGQEIPEAILNEARLMVSHWVKTAFFDCSIGKIEKISLHDFITVCFTLMSYAGRLTEHKYPNAQQVKKALEPFLEIERTPLYSKAWKSYYDAMFVIGFENSDLASELYVLKHELKTALNREGMPVVCFSMQIYCMRPPCIHLTLDGHSRPFTRVAWALAEPTPHLDFAAVAPEELGLPYGRLMSVYIQSHALKRLSERMDGIPGGILHFHLHKSFEKVKAHKVSKKVFLFEFSIFDHKTGYLWGEVLDGIVLIRTFLFLTNNGTPEAENLRKATGLQKKDTIYLNINKFSTFLQSDIRDNEKVKQIFIEAGCGSLFEIPEYVYYGADKEKKYSVANLIQKYLDTGK